MNADGRERAWSRQADTQEDAASFENKGILHGQLRMMR